MITRQVASDEADRESRLRSIASVVDALAGRDFDQRAPVNGSSDIIDGLAAAVNALAERLAAEHLEAERRVDERTAELRAAMEQLERRALYDELTGLPNRVLFADRLNELQSRVKRHGGVFSVLLVDMDDFKEINSTIGHPSGDRVLVQFAERLRSSVRPGDTVARLGGDQFAILMPATTRDEAEQTAERLAREVRAPVKIEERPVVTTASIGVVTCGPDDLGDIVRNARVALHAAKKAKGVDYQVYRSDMDASVLGRLQMSGDLRSALQRSELSLVYQPIVHARSHIAEGVEALLRWHHPQRGNVPPSEFIPLAERTGVIHEIGLWVLETACSDLVAWRRRHPAAEPLKLSVNLSTRQLQRPELIGKVADILDRTGMPPTRLTLEVTESALVERLAEAVEPLQRLRDLGIRIAIDDFGTGYSSLNYLRRLPVDEVKIDRSFVEGIAEHSHEWAFAAAIVRLIKTLGLSTVAEGVEGGGQLAHVMAIGCDLAQGYHFGRPGPLTGVESLLQAKAG